MPQTPPPTNQTLVHFYRAVVGHSDVWRLRMDATTNWAAATTAAMTTFAFSAEAPHFILLLALGFDSMFLLMESRRYQMYNLWWRRFLALNRYLITPALSPQLAPDPEILQDHMDELAIDLGHTSPRLRLIDAAGYRIRRNYGFMFTLVVVAWLSKVGAHPGPATSIATYVDRAGVSVVPGELVLAAVGVFLAATLVLAFTAPTEKMVNWVETPPALRQWLRSWRRSEAGRPPPPERPEDA